MYTLQRLLKPALLAFALAIAGANAHAEPVTDELSAAGGGDSPAAAQHASAASTPLGRMHVIDPVPALFAGPDTTVFALGDIAAPAGTLAELSGSRVEGAFPVRAPGRAARVREDGLSAPLPAPHGWIVLLCGLVVVAFMARRKIMLMAA